MSKATRMLAMTGMALVAGATIGAGPAAASTSTAQGTTSGTQGTQQTANANRGHDWVEGYFRSRGLCERVGFIGERRGRWDDYDCDRVRRGFRSLWRLEVERHWRGSWHNWSDGNGNWNDRGRGHSNWNNSRRDGHRWDHDRRDGNRWDGDRRDGRHRSGH